MQRHRRSPSGLPFLALTAATGFFLAPGSALSQTSAARGTAREPQRQEGPVAVRETSGFRGALGVPVAERLLISDDPAERLRGIVRLGAIGTPEAIDALIDALEQGSSTGRDPKARLLAVRALAEHASRDNVRQLLARELNDATGVEGRGPVSPLGLLTRATAALALARVGDKKALAPLIAAIPQGGAAAEAAMRALRAYPPTSLAPFLEGKKRLSPQLATFLGELGDLRAIERLRAMLAEPDQAGKAAAAVALAKLGDEAALAPARTWMTRSDPRLLRASAEVLTELGAPDAPQALASLLASETLRAEGVKLAFASPSPALAKVLGAVVSALPEDERPRAVAALGRAGGPEAVKQLTALLAQPERATDAAFALAVIPGDEARAAIEAAIADPRGTSDRAWARLALRAGIVRSLVLRDAPGSLDARLEELLSSSKDPRDRAVAAFGAVATGARSSEALIEAVCPGAASGELAAKGAAARSPLATCDHAVIHAAARGALARGPAALKPFMAILRVLGEAAAIGAAPGDRATGPRSPGGGSVDEEAAAVAAGVALLVYPDGGELPTSLLAAWAEGGGPLAPLAARALPSRDDEVIRGRIKRLLEGSDPVVRAHVALGLGRDPESDSVTLLASAYRFEEDAVVRRAIVRALSRRTEVQRTRALVVARDLDPDEGVRALARSALSGRVLDEPAWPSTGAVLWVTLAPNEPRAAARVASRAARVVRSDGLAVPVVADPDGVLLVPGMPPGSSSLLLGRSEGP